MKKKILLILLLSTSVLALPDLQVKDVVYSEETGRLVATIFNQADEEIEQDILVHFYDNGVKVGEKIHTDTLPRYSLVSLYIEYQLNFTEHNFTIIVDPYENIEEKDNNNNQNNLYIQGEKTQQKPIDLDPQRDYDFIWYLLLGALVLIVFYTLIRFIPTSRKSNVEEHLENIHKEINELKKDFKSKENKE